MCVYLGEKKIGIQSNLRNLVGRLMGTHTIPGPIED